jgi:hypothetical protein
VSSSTTWYALGYLEAVRGVRPGDSLLQVGVGSGGWVGAPFWYRLFSAHKGSVGVVRDVAGAQYVVSTPHPLPFPPTNHLARQASRRACACGMRCAACVSGTQRGSTARQTMGARPLRAQPAALTVTHATRPRSCWAAWRRVWPGGCCYSRCCGWREVPPLLLSRLLRGFRLTNCRLHGQLNSGIKNLGALSMRSPELAHQGRQRNIRSGWCPAAMGKRAGMRA